MIMTATVAFFAGAMIGLRFNVKMVANFSLLIAIACGLIAITGLTSVASASLYGLVAIACLQVGYVVTLLLAAMGYVDNRTDMPVPAGTSSDAPDRQIPAQSQKTH